MVFHGLDLRVHDLSGMDLSISTESDRKCMSSYVFSIHQRAWNRMMVFSFRDSTCAFMCAASHADVPSEDAGSCNRRSDAMAAMQGGEKCMCMGSHADIFLAFRDITWPWHGHSEAFDVSHANA